MPHQQPVGGCTAPVTVFVAVPTILTTAAS
jgi:hypothetical protein